MDYDCEHWSATLVGEDVGVAGLFTTQDLRVSSFHISLSSSFKPLNGFVIKHLNIKTQLCLLALLCGDIAVNPGPTYVPKYPCGGCGKAAKWGQQAIECDNCNTWFHRECIGLSEAVYNVLAQHNSYSWICCTCGLPQFEQSLFGNSSIDLANSFDPLLNLHVDSESVLLTSLSDQNASVDSISSLSDSSSTFNHSPIHCSSPKPEEKSNKKKEHSKNHKTLKILNVNCQSVSAKVAPFLLLLETEDPDVVVGTESWLHDGIASGEIFPPCYQVFRKDRESDPHGGVFLAIKNSILANEEKELATQTESIWASIHVKGVSPVFIGAFYRSQTTNEDYIKQLDTALSKIPKQASVWLLGDFNLPDVDWEKFAFKSGGRYPAQSKAMIEIAMDHNLFQKVTQLTREKSILDLCFTNSPSFGKDISVTGGISDHDVVIVDVNVKPKFVRPVKRKIFLYRKANYQKISDDVSALNQRLTPDYISEVGIEELWSTFRDTLLTSMNKHIPSKMSASRFSLPWVNHSIKRDIRKKKRYYSRARKNGSSASWEKFKAHRRVTDRRIRKAYRNYVRDTIGGSLKENNTKPFWNFLKTKKQEVFGVSNLKTTDGGLASLPVHKANALNEQFCSVFTKENLSDVPSSKSCDIPDISDITVTVPGVKKLLDDIKPHKASGPDEIPGRVLRECAASIAPVFTKIFNKSLSSGELPSDWLNANVAPLFKKGDRSSPANYRPVSLTSITCKLLEHIIHHHIMNHMDYHNILYSKQHGFRKGLSCETQLAGLVDDLAKIVDSKGQADLIIMDFSKAFDTVPYKRLLLKLQNVGIRNNILTWIECFLTKRHQRVVLDGAFSTKAKVTLGVPQGTVLGPLLFLIYINDLPDNIRSDVRLFADDCILYRKITSQRDQLQLQADIDVITNWERRWQMSFNKSKCYSMRMTHKKKPAVNTYNMSGTPLEDVNSYPYLGVEISKDMNWAPHINKISKKANKMLGLLRRNLHSCSADVKSIAYKALVRPRLEYCNVIWDPHHETHKYTIERVQRRAARFVTSDYNRETSASALVKSLDWDTLEDRRTKSRLITIYKESRGLLPNNIDQFRYKNTRQLRQLNDQYSYNKPRFNKDCYKFSLYPRTIPEWNLLPTTSKMAPDLNNFKSSLDSLDVNNLVKRAHFKI
jgi:hypothetical protein